MGHLFRLELKKYKWAGNGAFTAAAIGFSILFITVSLVDSVTDPLQTKDTFESTFMVISLLMSFIFLVYAAVLTARTVIGEYQQGTITILFSYPVNRYQLIGAKLLLIMIYTAVSMAVGYLCCCGYVIAADSVFDWLEGSFQTAMLGEWVPSAAVSVLVCVILSLWSFIIGMIRKSVPMTIVTSLIVLFVRQLIITKNSGGRETVFQVLLAAGLTLGFMALTFRKRAGQLY